MNTEVAAANVTTQGSDSGGNALRATVAELSALDNYRLRKRATSLGVAYRNENGRMKTRKQLLEACQLALKAKVMAELLDLDRNQMRTRATTLDIVHRHENGEWKTRNDLLKECWPALEAQLLGILQEFQRSGPASLQERTKDIASLLPVNDSASMCTCAERQSGSHSATGLWSIFGA